jgi:peptidoglycan/LPS O-acetylase OafA/YrhL
LANFSISISARSIVVSSPVPMANSAWFIASYPDVHYDAAIWGLRQAWTLGAELVFYVAAPLLLRSWRVAVLLLLASLGMRAAFVLARGVDLNTWTYFFIGSTFGFFLLGHLVCLAGRRWPMLSTPTLGWALLASSAIVMTFGGSFGGFDSPRFWGAVGCFTLALPGLFEATKGVQWMNRLGDLSYPLYLTHTTTLILVAPIWTAATSLHPLPAIGYAATAVFLALSTLAAAAVHWLLERPAARALRWITQGQIWRWGRA